MKDEEKLIRNENKLQQVTGGTTLEGTPYYLVCWQLINAGEELKAKDYFKTISGSKLFEDTEEQRLRDAFRKKFGHEIDA